ncbi:MAG: choice-of-anchor D domain-containing protein, partial [Bacteroidota bacterium]
MCLSVSSLCAQINIIFPADNDTLIAGTDTLITWEGVSPLKPVIIEYSTNSGVNWILLDREASGGSYLWKNIPKSTSGRHLIKITHFAYKGGSAEPEIEWERSFGGSNGDYAGRIIQDKDGNYLAIGTTHSSEYGGVRDAIWLLKIDPRGDLIWQKNYGGSWHDSGLSIIENRNGGYVFLARASSNDGDVTRGKQEESLIWVVSIDKEGNINWERNYKDNTTFGDDIKQTKDGGFIICGMAAIKNKSEDYFILKIDSSGNEEWRKSYGGLRIDYSWAVDIADDGYLISGYTDNQYGASGDVSVSKGYADIWLIKLDKEGNLIWDKTYGSAGWEGKLGGYMKKTTDGGFVICSNVYTDDYTQDVTDSIECATKNLSDVWVLKIDSSGIKQWDKCYGDCYSFRDGAHFIDQTYDGGYVIGAHYDRKTITYPDISDFEIIKTDESGNLLWHKSIGGSNNDFISTIRQTMDGGYIISGVTDSNDGDVSVNHGKKDIWIVKLGPDCLPYSDTAAAAVEAPTAEARDINLGDALWCAGKDTVIHDWIVNTGEYEVRIDSIAFEGEYAGDFSYEHDFPFTIHPGRNEDIMFGFHPDSAGGRSAKIIIYTQADTLEYTIRAEGLEPELLLLSDSIDFGNVCVNNNDTLNTILIKNTGELEVEITNIFLDDPVSRFALIDGGTAVLAPDSTLSLSLSFAPKEAELLENTLIIEYECMPKPLEISLKGLGVLPEPELLLDEIDFGSVCLNSADTMLTAAVRNMGTSPIDFTEIYFEHPAFNLIEPSVPLTIQPDSVMMIRLSFKPETIEKIADTLKLSYKCSEEPLSIVMRGEGYASELDIVKDILEFGEVCQGQTETLKFTINNKGENEIAYINLRLDNQAVTDYEINSENPVGPLAPGSSAEIEISFTPGN